MARGLSYTQDAVLADLARRADAPGERLWQSDTMIPGNYRTYVKLRSLGFIETRARSYYWFDLRITDAGIQYVKDAASR